MNNWTKTRPVIDGWYWYRPTDKASLEDDPDGKVFWPVEINNGQMYEDNLLIDWHTDAEYQPIKLPE